MRLQSAIEYLTTYGWAIIIIAIVLLALFNLGLFNPGSFVSTTCVFPSEFGCLTAILTGAGGSLNITLQQSTSSPINITAIGCNDAGTVNAMTGFSTPITLPVGGSNTFIVTCYQKWVALNIQPGQVYKGYIIVNYTNVNTGFPHTVTGTLVAKAV